MKLKHLLVLPASPSASTGNFLTLRLNVSCTSEHDMFLMKELSAWVRFRCTNSTKKMTKLI